MDTRLKEMEQTKEEGGLERMPKKEALHFQREVDCLFKLIGLLLARACTGAVPSLDCLGFLVATLRSLA